MGHSQFDEENSIGEKSGKEDVLVETGAVPEEAFVQGDTWSAKLQRFAGKFKIEQRGIERVPENERTDTNGVLNVGTMVRECALFFLLDEWTVTILVGRSGSQRIWWSARSQ
jgi:hypothetical protein